jgi:hypothetical protein
LRLYKLEEDAKPIRVQTPFVVSTILVQTTLVVSSRAQVSGTRPTLPTSMITDGWMPPSPARAGGRVNGSTMMA